MARTKFQDYAEYYTLRAALFFIQLFPKFIALKIGKILAIIAYYLVPIRREYVISAIKTAFPQKTNKEILTIIKNTYKNLAKTIIGIAFIPKMSDEKIKNMMTIDENLLQKAHEKGKGAVIMSAHFGNWELTALSMAKRYPVSVIVAKQSNPFIDEIMNYIRTHRGYNTISRDDYKSSARQVLKALKNNEFIAILADQNESKNGIFIPFFGKLCSMPRGAALFALRVKCPIFTAFGVHNDDGSMNVELKEIELPQTGDIDKDVEIINTIYSQRLEEVITKYPHQWLWFHKKWKTRPDKE